MERRRRVHIVDDDDAIRHSASFMLRHAGFDVATYASGPLFLDALKDSPDGCVLLDVRMPDMDGLEVQAELTARGAALPVIVLTGHGDVSVAVQAMKAGASDFLEKPFEKLVLLDALETAFASLEEQGAQEILKAKALAKLSKLTPREQDILDGIVRGQANKAIARELDISPRTVEIHRAHMMEKLEAGNVSEALRVAFAAGLGLEQDQA
ncbi:MAG: response regulator [Pseudomonadota bacterium]